METLNKKMHKDLCSAVALAILSCVMDEDVITADVYTNLLIELEKVEFDIYGNPVCPYCNGGRIQELRVQMDQKVITGCVCGSPILDIARDVFQAGYDRAVSDMKDR